MLLRKGPTIEVELDHFNGFARGRNLSRPTDGLKPFNGFGILPFLADFSDLDPLSDGEASPS